MPLTSRQSARQRRWMPILGFLFVGGLVAYGIVSISIGEGGPIAVQIDGSDQVQRLYGAVAQEGAELGSPDAPVTVSLFTDIQCSDCGDWFVATVPPLVDRFVRGGSAKLELRHFSQGGKPVQLAAVGAAAAGEQGRQWQYAHLFILNQDQVPSAGLDEDFLLRVAGGVPRMEADRWQQDFESADPTEEVEADAELATQLRLPAGDVGIVEGAQGSRTLEDSPSVEQIADAIAAVR